MKLALLSPSKARHAMLAGVFVAIFGICSTDALAQRSYYRFTPIADAQPQFPYQSVAMFPAKTMRTA